MNQLSLELNVRTNPEIFNIEAEKWAKSVADTTHNQVRNFYNEVIQLWELAQREGPDNFNEIVLPLFKMLRARAKYSERREHVKQSFVDFIEQGTAKVKSFEDLRNFKLVFEALVAFHTYTSPSKNYRR